jgi:predicted SprT family Zn-dependent metalloprotease
MEIHHFLTQIHLPIQKILLLDYPFLNQWRLSLDNAKRRAGFCRLHDKTISISRLHIKNNNASIIRDTLLHEYAHAIAFENYHEYGHGIFWKKVALTIGAIPQAKGRFNLPDAPWVLLHQCKKTQKVTFLAHRYRRNKKIHLFHLKGQRHTQGELYYWSTKQYHEYQIIHHKKNDLIQNGLEHLHL